MHLISLETLRVCASRTFGAISITIKTYNITYSIDFSISIIIRRSHLSDSHEVLPNAPLALVAVEIRFLDGTKSSSYPVNLWRAFREVLGQDWVIETRKVQSQVVSFNASGPFLESQPTTTVPKFTIRDRTMAIALTGNSVTVEATEYHHYPQFREIIEAAVDATTQVVRPDGISRIGMRYIDEIRVPEVTRVSDIPSWAKWLDPSLVAPKLTSMANSGYTCSAWDGAVQFDVGEDRYLVFRYGPRPSYVVNPDGEPKRTSPPPMRPVFMWDFDCFWTPSDIPEFDPAVVVSTCDELRRPIRTLFDILTTEQLKAEFMKEGRNG